MFRREYLEDIEAELSDSPTPKHTSNLDQKTLNNIRPISLMYQKQAEVSPLTLSDFFSKPTKGILDRNLYELGEDRTLTVRFLERGLSCVYEPRAICWTECPDTLKVLMSQRRRWVNSTFVNLICMVMSGKLWLQPKSFIVMLFCCFDLIGGL